MLHLQELNHAPVMQVYKCVGKSETAGKMWVIMHKKDWEVIPLVALLYKNQFYLLVGLW